MQNSSELEGEFRRVYSDLESQELGQLLFLGEALPKLPNLLQRLLRLPATDEHPSPIKTSSDRFYLVKLRESLIYAEDR